MLLLQVAGAAQEADLIASEAKELWCSWEVFCELRDTMTSPVIDRTSRKRFSVSCSRTGSPQPLLNHVQG